MSPLPLASQPETIQGYPRACPPSSHLGGRAVLPALLSWPVLTPRPPLAPQPPRPSYSASHLLPVSHFLSPSPGCFFSDYEQTEHFTSKNKSSLPQPSDYLSSLIAFFVFCSEPDSWKGGPCLHFLTSTDALPPHLSSLPWKPIPLRPPCCFI